MGFYIYEPTVRPYDAFDAGADAKALRTAMKGIGTDEGAIIAILTQRAFFQRQEIIQAYKSDFGRDLIKDLKDELGGAFEKLILALMETPYEYLAHELNRAMKGVGTNEDVITEILCTRSNQDIHGIVSAYQEKYGESLEDAIGSEVSGHYKRLFVMLLNGARDETSGVDMDRAVESAQALFDAGTKTEVFPTLLARESFPQLQVIFDEYRKISGQTIEQVVRAELSGDMNSAILTFVKCAKSRNRYFAEKLENAMKGAETPDNTTLMRIIISRCEIDLGGIKRDYQDFYGKTLSGDVKETSADYKNALLILIGDAPEHDTGSAMDLTENGEEDMDVQFLELLKCEEESERYLEQLNAQEADLRKAVDLALAENHSLLLLESAFEAKISAQRQARENLGVELLQERNKQMKKESERVRAEADSIRMETFARSKSMMVAHMEDTTQLENRLKQYWSPKAVANALNMKKVLISQIQSQIHEGVAELKKVNAELSKLHEYQNNFNVFHDVVMESKEFVDQDKENQF